MKKSIKNKMGMYKTVKGVVNSSSIWNGFTAFEAAFQAFSDKLDQLEDFAYNQTLALVGVSTVKTAKRELAAKKTLQLAGAINAYASTVDDSGLLELMKITASDLVYKSGQQQLQIMDRVLEQAEIHLQALADYGVTQAIVTEFEALRDEMDEVINSPRNAIVGRKVMTEKLDELVTEIDTILKQQLDKLMLALDPQDHEFFLSYNAARVIVDHKAHHSSGESEEGPAETPGYGE